MQTLSPRQTILVRDADELARTAAERVMACFEANSDDVAICLTGGSGPTRLFTLLGSPPYSTKIPWRRVHWFMGDDRFVPPDDPLSNMGAARRAFLDTYAPQDHVHAIPTNLPDPQVAANAYQATLAAFYGSSVLEVARPLFDLVLMGIGPDGHTASLFPGFPEIEINDRWTAGVPLANVAPFVPRVTLTLPALSSCHEMLFLLGGESKRDVVRRALRDPNLPAVRARSQNRTVWLLDAAATPEEIMSDAPIAAEGGST